MDSLSGEFDMQATHVGVPATSRLADGRGWSIHDYVCEAGPGDRPFEERHESVSIAAVVAGSFNYASDRGRALLHPGALLLGNHGACYECGHDHGVGDRCIAVKFAPDYFAEIAATAAGSSKFRFPAAMLPSARETLPHTVMLEAGGRQRDRLKIEEDLVGFVAGVVRALSGAGAVAARVSAQDSRRLSRALRHIENHAEQPLDLDRLAGVAAMSKFHFLRVFRRALGTTPYQHVLALRLRRAALRLLTTPEAVSAIAYDSGFGDLSTFNAAFRERFGKNPTAFRRAG
ncbi:AraC family transcriptional regulator [Mesorhizobium sp. LHD-90]|uniref:AraC family transcriptional regulator n=1 Tax=Mesorhizobium sp. LHD-90 TaxID=3071414 RepID=UPI0027E16229|nr:AraC family transcriptional regulator [Mesorhizobium sp. LHD-90]MDQ6433695.1 AraC family transcriptional regulator [Mesorhizobium sp. LHD-90]